MTRSWWSPNCSTDRVTQRPLPPRGSGTRALPQRRGRTEVPVPRHPVPRPHRTRSGTMGHPLEGRSQRLRHHLRRTHQPVEQLRRRTALTPFVAPPPASLFAEPKAGRWWLAARRGEITAHSNRQDPPDAYAVSITVAPPVHWRGNLSNLIKPLADGLVSALHSHMGHVDHVLERASAI